MTVDTSSCRSWRRCCSMPMHPSTSAALLGPASPYARPSSTCGGSSGQVNARRGTVWVRSGLRLERHESVVLPASGQHRRSDDAVGRAGPARWWARPRPYLRHVRGPFKSRPRLPGRHLHRRRWRLVLNRAGARDLARAESHRPVRPDPRRPGVAASEPRARCRHRQPCATRSARHCSGDRSCARRSSTPVGRFS